MRATCAAAGVPEAADEALANNAALAARCRLELELGVPIFPRAPLPEGESGPGWLRRQAEAGLARRYGRDGAAPAGARAAGRGAGHHRAARLHRLLPAGRRDRRLRPRAGIPTVGRGSGASSIVAYVLGITNVDPLRHGLCFERFLHPQRRDCPDLDIDLCWQRRDEVIAHVYETYGRDRVAMISTHATLGARSAFRETAKALGVSNARVNALAKRMPRELEAPYLDKLERLPDARFIAWREPPLVEALRLAERLDGAPRHLSVHCGGIVIADRPLTYYVPLERAAKDVVVTQFEMRAIERIGLVKMDLLGNRALSTIGECVTLARRGPAAGGAPPPPRCSTRTSSPRTTPRPPRASPPATRSTASSSSRRRCATCCACWARARSRRPSPPWRWCGPGPAESGMKEAFCRRPAGSRRTRSSTRPRARAGRHARRHALRGGRDARGRRARRALAGRGRRPAPRHRGGAGDEDSARSSAASSRPARAAAWRAEAARAVWRDLARFAAYAFCKAHAAGYGALAWQSAYFKAHFPAEWAVGVLNHHAGMYPTWVHVEDLRRRGRATSSRRA